MIITIVLKGGKGSGWFAPGKGTHSGEKHRQVGSGKAVVRKKTVVAPKGGQRTTTEWLDAHQRELFIDTDNIAAEDAMAMLNEVGLPTSHLEGLKITAVTPNGYVRGYDSYKKVGGRGPRINGRLVSSGSRGGKQKSKAYVHPARMMSSTLIHEIGHHRYHQYMRGLSVTGGRSHFSDTLYHAFDMLPVASGGLSRIGLRSYSRTSVREFFADIYITRYYGSSDVWDRLVLYCNANGLDIEDAVG